ncbi:hypothetical protein CAEBREN_07954 [Caenorhabditis brenneri]|uniref:Uncharacterized protein n=1 Tax=Caenorhabditis brenneri TaxID=135651 RepID=G0MA53_CAEBE|nr:hypothetical protein CAEBREN_07954 [Caenorhabditis brenneri]
MGAKDSKPRSMENHGQFCDAVFPYIDKLIDEMEKSEHLEISTEDRKSKKQCVIKVKFNCSDEFYSDDLSSPTLRSLKRDDKIESDPTPTLSGTAGKTTTKNDSDWKKVEEILEERIKTDIKKIDNYDPSSQTLNESALEPDGYLATLDYDIAKPRLTDLEKRKTGLSWNKIFGSKRYSKMKATGNSVFYDQDPVSLDPNTDTTDFNSLLSSTSSDNGGIDHQPKLLDLEELTLEPDPMNTVSADLEIETPDAPSAKKEAPCEPDLNLRIADLEFPPIETEPTLTFLNDMLKGLSLRPPAEDTLEDNSVEEALQNEYQEFVDSVPVVDIPVATIFVETSSPVTEPFIPKDDSSEEQGAFQDQHQSLQLPFFNSAKESLWNSLVSTKTNEKFFIPEEDEEEFLNLSKKQKDDLAILLRCPHEYDSSTEEITQKSQIVTVVSPETMQNPLLPQPSSSYSGYEDKFASLERISQEELAIKLAEQDRLYEEKLNELKRKRKEKNEDAQEEIQAIRESQKERVRMVYHK